MKKLTFLLAFAFSISFAYSQTLEPQQHTFSINDSTQSIQLNGSEPYFQINKILNGWHWGGERKISSAMFAQQNDMRTWYGIPSDTMFNNDARLLVKSTV